MSAIDLTRLARAVHLDAVRRDDVTWHVTGVDSFHVVSVGDSGLLCDCEDCLIRHATCKHLIAVGLAVGDRQVLQALRQLVSDPSRYPARKRQGAA